VTLYRNGRLDCQKPGAKISRNKRDYRGPAKGVSNAKKLKGAFSHAQRSPTSFLCLPIPIPSKR